MGGAQVLTCSVPFVGNEVLCYQLDKLCLRYHKRPSEVIGIKSTWIAYDFDSAVIEVVEKIQKYGWSDVIVAKKKQTKGFGAVKALQQQVQASYVRNKVDG